MRKLRPTPKGHTADLDKLTSPEDTVALARERLARFGRGVLAETRRIDTGRLGIPVYMSLCGEAAREIMPTRKQMGKGASPAQAEASALMELVERFSFFSYWSAEPEGQRMTWSEARSRFGAELMPIAHVLQAVGEDLPEETARRIMDLLPWRFAPVRDLSCFEDRRAPLDFFKKLNEFNGSSAGNCLEESILQGACELVERHVSALCDRDRPTLPTIDPRSADDPALAGLLAAFAGQGIKVWLKDMTLGLPAPTVAALAYDPATFPERSEIVLTAGTAASPAKAAIRALTEVAQLAGDFETRGNYEASGLPKPLSLAETNWLTAGPTAPLSLLPSIEHGDILAEIETLGRRLAASGHVLYTADISHPALGLAANYSFVPGFQFRERAKHASLGLFVGRVLAEEARPDKARRGLDVLAEIYHNGHFLPFFEGLLALRLGDAATARDFFARAEPRQPSAEDAALAAFYQAHALCQEGRHETAEPILDRAIALSGEVKEYFNLRGVCRFRAGRHDAAALDFEAALALDPGSTMDLANLGLCRKLQGRREEAAHYLAEALNHDPDLDFARTHLEELFAGLAQSAGRG